MANPFAKSPDATAPSAWSAMRAEDEEARGGYFGGSGRSSSSGRSSTAHDAIQALKAGSDATKYGKQGAPHMTRFTLSTDERTLSWVGVGLMGKLLPKERVVHLANVKRLLIGRESAVFERFQNNNLNAASAPGLAHLSISLKFDPASGTSLVAARWLGCATCACRQPAGRASSRRAGGPRTEVEPSLASIFSERRRSSRCDVPRFWVPRLRSHCPQGAPSR